MIFILGGGGFVGSAFARLCESRGLDHAVVTRSNYSEYAGRRCETLVNADGNSSRLLGGRDPVEDFERSVLTVKRSISDFGFSKYVLASSCDVYPDVSSPEATREDSAPDPAAQSPYGFHKRLAELCVAHACGDWLVLRLAGMVGPGLKKNPVYDILHGGPLWVSPDSRMQYMHTDDVAAAAMKIAGSGSGTYNLCGSGTVRIGDLPGAGAVPVTEGSPVVVHDASNEKAARLVSLPGSRETAEEFMRGYGSTRG